MRRVGWASGGFRIPVEFSIKVGHGAVLIEKHRARI